MTTAHRFDSAKPRRWDPRQPAVPARECLSGDCGACMRGHQAAIDCIRICGRGGHGDGCLCTNDAGERRYNPLGMCHYEPDPNWTPPAEDLPLFGSAPPPVAEAPEVEAPGEPGSVDRMGDLWRYWHREGDGYTTYETEAAARKVQRDRASDPDFPHVQPAIVRPPKCEKHATDAWDGTTRCPCTLPCPQCHAGPGAPCKRPSEHPASGMHVRRAVAAEFVDSLCGHQYRASEYTSRDLPVPPFAIDDRPTVKRPDLWGNVHDTYQTETELNGWKPTQGVLL